MQTIPLQPIPSQILAIVLAGQQCQIAVYQKPQAMFVDINVNGTDIVIAAQARDAILLNPSTYQPFQGNLLFDDTQGNSDPTYDGLGSRYQLVYLTADEFAEYQLQGS